MKLSELKKIQLNLFSFDQMPSFQYYIYLIHYHCIIIVFGYLKFEILHIIIERHPTY